MEVPDRLYTLDYRFFLPLCARLPARLAYRLAELRGRFYCGFKKESRDSARDNIWKVFPELELQQVEKIVQDHFQTRSCEEMEVFWYGRPCKFFDRFIQIENLDVLRNAAESGRGVLLFSGHIGSIGLFFVTMGKHGFKMHIVGRSLDPEENPQHPTLLQFNRRKAGGIETAVGFPFVPVGHGHYPLLREKLREGAIVALLIDVIPLLLKRTTPVNFFDRTCLFADGVASLYRETGARLIFWSIHRRRTGHGHRIGFQELSDQVRSDQSNQQIVQVLVNQLEQNIRQRPDQWHVWDSLTQFLPVKSDEA